MTDTIQYELRDTIATLRLARPEQHNSLGAHELAQLTEVLDVLGSDDAVRVLIITGEGEKTFCAGAALDDLNAGRITPQLFQSVMQRVADLPVPTLGRINGNIFGGGTALAMACDFRIGVEGTVVRVPAAALGLCYPPAGISRFVQRLGGSLTRRMLMGAETLKAAELHRLGFYDYLVSAEALDDRTDELAIHLDGLAPLAVKAMKEIIRSEEANCPDPARAEELFRVCDQSDDLQEGFAAMREKRAPGFLGR